MYEKQLLDHGYLKLVESWGSDQTIIEAARMSTDRGFLGWGGNKGPCSACGVTQDAVLGGEGKSSCLTGGKHDWTFVAGDEKLLRYLYENKHSTPFEMAGATFEIQAPIFVFREWHRHRTQSYSELSARYTPLPDVNYVPTIERLMTGSDGKNRQAGTVKDAVPLTKENAEAFQGMLRGRYAEQEQLYQWALKAGVPKELARVHLPVGRYSRMRASANLRNWLAFLTLRMAPNAQWEIRQYANAVGEVVSTLFPRTWGLFSGGTK